MSAPALRPGESRDGLIRIAVVCERMAYNKSKFVEAAQKLLNQGKVAQAIAEYQQILKYEPRDQVTLMTIGELYIRQGETLQAIDYFERLAQLFVSDGFLTKAIAVYKRIAKLAPEEIRPLEKLADLYPNSLGGFVPGHGAVRRGARVLRLRSAACLGPWGAGRMREAGRQGPATQAQAP